MRFFSILQKLLEQFFQSLFVDCLKMLILPATLFMSAKILNNFLNMKPIVAQSLNCIIIVSISILLIFVCNTICTKLRHEKISKSNFAKDYKCAMDITTDKNRKKWINIVTSLQMKDIKPLVKSLNDFHYIKLMNLTEENVFKIRSNNAYLQISFIIKNTAGEYAVFQRVGNQLSTLPQVLSGYSILRSFSPATLRKSYIISTIMNKIGVFELNNIHSIKPYGIGYNESTKNNNNLISYFFLIYELEIINIPETGQRYGDCHNTSKPGEILRGFYKPNCTDFYQLDCKGNLDRKIINTICNNSDITLDSYGKCILVALDEDILSICIKRSINKE